MAVAGRQHYRILGISGSLRRDSFNTWLIHNCARHAPEQVSIECYGGLGALPLYNPDVDDGRFAEVNELRSAIREADGLLISTPEYNYGIPGGLKNLLDWASKPTAETVLAHKPVGIAGVSSGNFGTVRAQAQLRQILLGRNSDVVTRPEVLVFRGADRFGPEGEMTDEGTLALIRELLAALVRRIEINRIEYPPT